MFLVLVLLLLIVLPLYMRSRRALAVYAGLVAVWANLSAAVATRRPDAFMPMGDVVGAMAVIVAALGLALRAWQLRFERLYAYLCGGALLLLIAPAYLAPLWR